MTKREFKLFVWNENVLTDYGDGLVVVAARDINEAREIVKADDPFVYEEIMNKEPNAIQDLPAYAYLYGSA